MATESIDLACPCGASIHVSSYSTAHVSGEARAWNMIHGNHTANDKAAAVRAPQGSREAIKQQTRDALLAVNPTEIGEGAKRFFLLLMEYLEVR